MERIHNYVSSFIVLALAGLICIILQKIFPSTLNQRWLIKDSKLNFHYWLVNNIIGAYFTVFFVAVALSLTALISPQLLNQLNTTQSEPITAVNLIIAIIAIDFVGYWIHRVFHSDRLWKFHSIHHSPTELDWMSSARFHPIEAIIIVAVTYTLVITAGLGIKTVGLAFGIRAAYGFIVHANLSWHYGPLGYVIASPYFHRWHHTKKKEGINKNYAGLFSIWDFIFGTAYFPKSLQPHNFGVHQSPGETFWQQFRHPFRK